MPFPLCLSATEVFQRQIMLKAEGEHPALPVQLCHEELQLIDIPAVAAVPHRRQSASEKESGLCLGVRSVRQQCVQNLIKIHAFHSDNASYRSTDRRFHLEGPICHLHEVYRFDGPSLRGHYPSSSSAHAERPADTPRPPARWRQTSLRPNLPI